MSASAVMIHGEGERRSQLSGSALESENWVGKRRYPKPSHLRFQQPGPLMSLALERFKNNYFLREHDSDFATGRRSEWVYALPSRRISFAYLNRGGPEPVAYLEYARRDVFDGTQQGAINALGHAKRAIHLVIDRLLETYCLTDWLKAPFPVRAELLRDLGALPTRMVSALNRDRNLMEHDYAFVEVDRVGDFVELTELFLSAGYPFFRGGVVGAYIGIQDGQCCECVLDRNSRSLIVADINVYQHVDFPFGRVHYNIERPEKLLPRLAIPVTRDRQSELMPFIDLFVYCTRREMLRLPHHDVHEDGVTYHMVSSKMYLLDETDSDQSSS